MDIEKLLKAPHITIKVLDSSRVNGAFIRRLMVKQNISPFMLSIMLQVKQNKIYKMCKSSRYQKGPTAMLLALINEDPSVAKKLVEVLHSGKPDKEEECHE